MCLFSILAGLQRLTIDKNDGSMPARSLSLPTVTMLFYSHSMSVIMKHHAYGNQEGDVEAWRIW